MWEVLVHRLGDLSLPRKSVVRLTDCLNMTIDVYHGRKTATQYTCNHLIICIWTDLQIREGIEDSNSKINFLFFP